MSFLKANPFSGVGAVLNPNGAAQGLGHLLNISPFGVSRFADTVGKVANGIAAGGGATAGYDGSAAAPQIDNHLQLLDPQVLRSIIAQFRPGPASTRGMYP